MSEPDQPEPGSAPEARDRLLEQADAAHDQAVRRLQDDVRLADRFQELEAEDPSKDPLFYRLRKNPTLKGVKSTAPGVGPVVEHPVSKPQPTIDPVSPEPRAAVARRGGTQRMVPAEPVAVPVEQTNQRSRAGLIVGLLALLGVVVAAIVLWPGDEQAAVRPTATASVTQLPSAAGTSTSTAPVSAAAPATATASAPTTATSTSTQTSSKQPREKPSSVPATSTPRPKSSGIFILEN